MTSYAHPDLDLRNDYRIPMPITGGSSDTAELIDIQIKALVSHYRDTTFTQIHDEYKKRALLEEVDTIATECEHPGWDGYDALPVPKNTIGYAHEFISALPPAIPKPSIGVEPDGCITFEWYRSRYCVFSISLSNDKLIHFAYLNRTENTHGSMPYVGSIPRDIILYINRIIN